MDPGVRSYAYIDKVNNANDDADCYDRIDNKHAYSRQQLDRVARAFTRQVICRMLKKNVHRSIDGHFCAADR